MMEQDGNSWVIPGAIILILLVLAALWWILPAKAPPGSNWQSQSYFDSIPLGSGLALTEADRIVRNSGFVPLTNAALNALIPVEDRSDAFTNTTVFRYVTSNTNDTRFLALPAQGEKCFLFIRCSSDVETVQKIQREINAFIKKLE
jgi:hypothetical protein